MTKHTTFKLGGFGNELVSNKGPFNPESICSKCGNDKVASVYQKHSHEYDLYGKWIDIPDWILRRCERCGYLWGEECIDQVSNSKEQTA